MIHVLSCETCPTSSCWACFTAQYIYILYIYIVFGNLLNVISPRCVRHVAYCKLLTSPVVQFVCTTKYSPQSKIVPGGKDVQNVELNTEMEQSKWIWAFVSYNKRLVNAGIVTLQIKVQETLLCHLWLFDFGHWLCKRRMQCLKVL